MDLNELRRRFPNASDAFLKRNAASIAAFRDSELRPADTKPDEGKPLVCRLPRKEAGRESTAGRLKIRFTIYAVLPADWDGYDIKHLQDMLCRAGILPDDNWRILYGEVVSEKVHSESEEKTIVEIIAPVNQA